MHFVDPPGKDADGGELSSKVNAVRRRRLAPSPSCQTIANLIATLAARRKKVLFVAEKRANAYRSKTG